VRAGGVGQKGLDLKEKTTLWDQSRNFARRGATQQGEGTKKSNFFKTEIYITCFYQYASVFVQNCQSATVFVFATLCE
jgi:hypothetical protein